MFSPIRVIKALVPYGIARVYQQKEMQKEKLRREAELRASIDAREKRRLEAKAAVSGGIKRPFDYEDAVSFLEELGIDLQAIRLGSMPAKNLENVRRHLGRLDTSRPIIALHIGNFLGISLAYLAHALGELHSQSRVVSIDPNLTFIGVARPMEAVLALLTHFGLEDRVAILTGYSLEKNISNDGQARDGYDPVANWTIERGCTQQLDLLGTLAPERFDLCLIDGNHDAEYLQRELSQIVRLLRRGGLLVLDDVSAGWPAIKSAFEQIPSEEFERILADGRIALLARN
jgi:predicted O-methyltransferase YrrM